MKRVLSSPSLSGRDRGDPVVTVATVSQANILGAEEACTAIAVMACADFLFPLSAAISPERMELWIGEAGQSTGPGDAPRRPTMLTPLPRRWSTWCHPL